MGTKGPIPEALRGLSIRDIRDLTSGVAEIKADLDTARAEAAALREEVEAMRAVVEAATIYLANTDCGDEIGSRWKLIGALGALRARKVGG